MSAGEIRRIVARERESALAVRDPIAITMAGERYKVLQELLKDVPDDQEIDIRSLYLTVSQAARALGYSAKEMRKLIRAGNVAAQKHDNQWRVAIKDIL